jgi:hypothetical protein
MNNWTSCDKYVTFCCAKWIDELAMTKMSHFATQNELSMINELAITRMSHFAAQNE